MVFSCKICYKEWVQGVGLSQNDYVNIAARPVSDLVFAISGLHTSLMLTAFRPVSYLVCCL